MNPNKIRIYIRLHWIKMLIIFILSVLGIFTVIVLSAGVSAMINLESFYKQLQFSAIPLQFFFSIVTAIIFAGIYTTFTTGSSSAAA